MYICIVLIIMIIMIIVIVIIMILIILKRPYESRQYLWASEARHLRSARKQHMVKTFINKNIQTQTCVLLGRGQISANGGHSSCEHQLHISTAKMYTYNHQLFRIEYALV